MQIYYHNNLFSFQSRNPILVILLHMQDLSTPLKSILTDRFLAEHLFSPSNNDSPQARFNLCFCQKNFVK